MVGNNARNMEVVELLRTHDDGTLVHSESMTLEFKESFNYAGLADYYCASPPLPITRGLPSIWRKG